MSTRKRTAASIEKQRVRSSRWYLKNREKAIQQTRAWRALNPERRAANARESYIKNRAKIIARSTQWNAENPLRARANQRKYRATAARLASVRKYRASNLESVRTRQRKWAGLPDPTRPRPQRCECCNRLAGEKRALGLDHCHHSGKFSGWLCTRCNLAIGSLGDTLAGALKASRICKTDSSTNSPRREWIANVVHYLRRAEKRQ